MEERKKEGLANVNDYNSSNDDSVIDINSAIENSDIMISISFGRISSCGTAFEQGYAYAKGIPVHVIQVTNEPTSLMTYWGSTSFINSDKNYGGIKSELRWILDNPRESNHGKCRTVLT